MSKLKTVSVTPRIEAVIKFTYDDSFKEVVVKEGQLLNNVTYIDGNEEKTISGVLKVINFVSKAANTGRIGCMHNDESLFAKYVNISSLTIDCSSKYDCKIIKVPVSSIRNIDNVKKSPTVEVNGVKYDSVAEAITNIKTSGTIILTKDISDDGIIIEENKDIVIDLNGHTYDLLGGVGSTGTETNGLQLLKGSNVIIKNGTLSVPASHKDKFYIGIQNYANLTLENVILDGKNLDRRAFDTGKSYALSNNSGTVNIIGNTSIVANDDGDKAFAFDVCKFKDYEPPVVNVNTTGKIYGGIEVSEGLDSNLTITGGTFTIDVSKWVPEGYVVNNNENGTYTVEEVIVAE